MDSSGTFMADEMPVWKPPEFHLGAQPPTMSTFHPPEHSDTDAFTNFFRNAKWSPDGNCILATLENRSVQLVTSPNGVISSDTSHTFTQAAPIVDAIWYPGACLTFPATFCIVISVRDCPVKLIDAADGRLRASYRIVDHRERHVAPQCLAFDPSATRLYCGFQDAIEVFDFNSPGKEGLRLQTSPSKKSKEGMKGIVSSISFSPDQASGLYAASSLNGCISICSGTHDAEIVDMLGGVKGPITQVQFHPARSHILYAAARRQDIIQSWDLRHTAVPVEEFHRSGRGTNQKIKFDIDYGGKWLASGDESGNVSFFDVSSSGAPDCVKSYRAHEDTIGSISFHPSRPLLLSASGGRHFDSPQSSSDESDTSSDGSQYPRTRTKRMPTFRESTLKVWSFEANGFTDTHDPRPS
ncbi:hypothetical protein FRC03_007420 [Tulasnella sp. 419]|nr:hypothetical protein FRC03_007420 [Tulasnella sp. 419]